MTFRACLLHETFLFQLNPRGFFVETTVVFSFHPTFLTKVDQAVKIQCFYMEANKTATAELDVRYSLPNG